MREQHPLYPYFVLGFFIVLTFFFVHVCNCRCL